jgi:hypothetical protein
MKYCLRAFDGYVYVPLSQYPEIVARNLPDIEVQCRKVIKAMGTLMEHCWMRPLFENEVSDQFSRVMADAVYSYPDAITWVEDHRWLVISKTEDKEYDWCYTREETG